MNRNMGGYRWTAYLEDIDTGEPRVVSMGWFKTFAAAVDHADQFTSNSYLRGPYRSLKAQQAELESDLEEEKIYNPEGLPVITLIVEHETT